ncbi:Ig-like domain repeat protein [uncultured Methanobrevibacter sp.]|uniref:Ig-like domain repeat protein n=1 Tax=uncultured Methanobrevibacter sp. TaxID=253161 RepID=UPI0025E67AD4|nr:Ig-like domain repeat protein [uncultured Methanobrevibacter sp.]
MNNKAFIIIGLILCLLFTIPMVSAAEVSADSDLIDNSVIGSNINSQAIATSDANGLESNIDDINSNIDSNINAHDNANNGDIIEGLNDNNTEIDIGSNNDDDNDKITDINLGNKNSNDKNILGANALTAVGDGNTFTDLEYLINKAISEGATSFTLPRDFTFTSGGDDSLINGITINSPITIIGGSHTIDGSNLARIFVINSNNVYLNGITFKNANASSEASFGANGGAVYVQAEGTITNHGGISNSTFINCYSLKDGGALYVRGDYFTLDNSSFINNTAGDDGGAIDWAGDYGRIYNLTAINNSAISYGDSSSKGGTLIVTGSNIAMDRINVTGSRAKGESEGHDEIQGGAIFLTGNNCNITNSTFVNCSVEFDGDYASGGALYILGNNTNVVKCNFTDNSATEDGGAIFIDGENCTLNHTVFINNTVHNDGGAIEWNGDNGRIYNLTAIDNCADSEHGSSKGGTLLITGDNAVIDKANISGSKVSGEHYTGDKALQGGAISLSGNNCNITNSVFTNCSVDFDGDDASGGALYIWGNFTNIINCNFTNNSATEDCGAIFIEGHDCSLNNTVFLNNIAHNDGGAIEWNGNNGKIYNMTADNNSADSAHGSSKGGTLVVTGSNMIMDGLKITNSYVDGDSSARNVQGGAIFLTGNNTNITNSVFEDCHIDYSGENASGGALYILGNNSKVENCNFTGNVAHKDGGAIYVSGSDVAVIDSNFIENFASESGGAIFLIDNKNSQINGSTFKTNVALLNGGAINFYAGAEDGLVSSCEFIDNSVWGAGGSVYWEGTRGIVEYSNFTGSRALGAVSDPNTGRGGSVIWLGDRGTIRECVFNDSQSTKEGSALYILGENDNVYYSNFTHCSSNTSGTVYIRGGYATIGNCYMNNNTVKENGGGIYVLGNFINLYDTSINNSKANKNGSGLYILGNRTQVSNTNLTNSDAASYGGFYIAGFRTVIDGARLENNTATNGSGIYVSGDQTEIKRTFFINNTANQSGGGLFYEGRGITLSDSVFDKNTAKTQKGGSIYFNGKQGDSILRCNFTNGWANTNAGGIAWTANGVGGLIKDCYFENMSSGQHGACIHWEKNQNGTIDNCTFVNSIARTTKNGGAVYMGTNPSSNFAVNPVISNCLIINCTQGNRGAINLLGINLTVVNNTFINITGVGGDTDGFRALEIENGLGALILNNTFINCSGNRQGSGVRVLAGENITVANNTFIDCHSTNAGGGIYSGAKGFQIFENNTFINNSGQKDGGAAAFANLVTSFKNNTFINNSIVVQSSSGGAVAVVANTVIDNSTFINNTALNNGGAVYSSGALTVNNSYFENNHADNNGGAIRVYSGNLRISNSSFFNNTAKVGGAVSRVGNVYVNGSSVFMYNKAETGSAISASNVYLTDVSLLQNQALFNQWSNQRDSRIGNHASINATFVGNDNLLNAINTTSAILSNVTYCGVDGGGLYEETTTNTNSVTAAKSTNEIHQIIILEIYDTENNLVDTLTTFTDANGKFNFEVDLANDANEYAYKIIHPEDNYYTGAEYTIGRALSELIIIPQNITHPEDENISFEVTGVAGQNPIGNITVFINDTFGNIIYNDTIFINESSQAILTLPRLNATEYYIYAKYNGDEIYLPDNETSIFHVNMAESFIVIEVQNYTYNETGNITITVPYIESGRISVIVRNDEGYTQSYTVYVDEGTEEIKIELPILDAGNYTVDALFYGNNNYFPSDNTTNFTVFKAVSIIDVSANNVSGGERSIVDIHVDPKVATQNVNVTVTDANGNVVAEYEDLGLLDSKTSITLPVLPKGRCNVTVHYGGDKNHNESDNDTIFYVTNDLFPIDIEAIDLTYGENETVNITVPKDANSEKLWVEVKWIENDESVIGNNTIANLGYSIDENGIVHIDTSTLETFFNVGNYSINVYYEGDDDFLSNSSIFGFEVFKADVEMMVIPQNISYGEIENITVEIPKLNEIGQNDALDLYVNSTNNESIRIFIEDYDIGTDGKAIWNLDNVILPAGEYIVEAVYAGSNNYKPTNRTERFTVSKVATWIEIEVNNIFVGEDEVINVTVHPNGEGGVTCNITLYVRDKEVTLQLNENGQASYTLADEVESTDISVIAIYNGDNNFNESKNSTTYNVTKQNTTTTVDALSPIKYGTLEDLNITVNFTDATGTITLYINSTADGFNNITKVFTLAETDEGKVNWDINGLVLPVGTYDVTAVYSGNDKYNNSTSQITLIVVEQNEEYEITVEANDTLYGDDEIIIVTVPEDAEGTVTISIDGNEIETKEVSGGKAIFNITGLEVHNDYNVTAIYNGDSNYKAGNTGDDLFNVTKAPSHIEVIAEDIDYRQTENITVSLADVNASGKIVISIINKTSGETIKTQDIDEFVTTEGIVYSFEGLEAGNYTVKVEFTDDHNYENSEDAYDFEVRKSVPEISEDSPDITYGNDETITVTVPTDASGTIDVLVDGVSIGVKTIGTDDLTFTISKPLADSKHNITLIYSGDSNYDPVTIIGEFAVDKLVPSIEIEVNTIFVGDDEVINITVIGLDGLEIPTGNLSILVKSLNETKVLNGGQASLSLENEVEGTDISVVVFYNGDSNYNATMASAAYNVTKKNTTTIVTGQTPITYGSIENLTITINETDVTGTLTLYVYDDFGDVNIIKVFEIGDSNVIEWNIDGEIFDVYSYNVTAVYSGDDKHIGSTGTFQFAVEPFGDFELSISAPGGEYLNVADVVVTVSPAIPGWIHLIINDSMIVYDSKMLQYGRVRFNVSNFEVGTYNITADYFYGVDYVSKDISIVFEVTKIDSHIKAIPEDIDYTQVENINVSLPDYNASGKLIITITNKSDSTQIIRTLEIDEFNATEGIVYSFEGLLPGNYTVKAEYINDHNYKDSEYTADFEVRKGDPTLTENSPDITYGEDENITVSITGVEGGLSPTGTIEVIVDGVIVDTITIGDDLEYIVIKPLADPKHNVTVVYSGDSNYNPLTITGEFEVTKASNEITVVPTNISYGQIENITVTVPDGATGTVSITVGTYTDTKEITDGISEIIFNIPKETGDDLLNANENYIVFANYSGDSNYESVVANAPFHVDPANTTVNIEANNIPYGNDEIINITVTGIEGAAIPAGFVTITINGTDIELTKRLDSEGKASFNISGLVVGEYNVTAKYESSTQNYNDSNSNALFNVTKADVKEENRNISAINITYGDDETITVVLNETNITGNVTITIGDYTDTKPLDNGKAVFTIAHLEANDYTVVANYSGDSNYNPISIEDGLTTGFKVDKANVTVEVDPIDIIYKETEKINVTVTGVLIDGEASDVVAKYNLSGKVTIYIDGVENQTKDISEIDENGILHFDVEGLAVGKHNVTAVYHDDRNYNDNSDAKDFNVDNALPENMQVNVQNITYHIESENIEIDLGEVLNGNLVVYLNNTEIYNAEVIDKDKITLSPIENLEVANYTVRAVFTANDDSVDANATFEVKQAPTVVSVEPINITYGEIENITVFVDNTIADKFNLTGSVTIYINGREVETKAIGSDGKAVFNVEGLSAADDYLVEARYHSDRNYLNSTGNSGFNVIKADVADFNETSDNNITAVNITYGEDETITLEFSENNITGKVTITINGEEIETKDLENGKVSFTVKDLEVNDYAVVANYSGDSNYNPKEGITTSFTVSKANSTVTVVPAPTVVYGNNETITVTVPIRNHTGTITLTINGTDYEFIKHLTAEDGDTIVLTNVSGLAVGTYNVTVKYTDDRNYNDSEASALFEVIKAAPSQITVEAQNITYTEDEIIVVTVGDANATGSVSITIGDYTDTVELDENGQAKFNVTGLVVGHYTVEANYSGDANYTSQSASAPFRVDKVASNVTVDAEDIIYGEIEYANITIPNYNATGRVIIKVDGKLYDVLPIDSNTPVKLELEGLDVGTHTIDVEYFDDVNYNNSIAHIEFNVTKATIPVGPENESSLIVVPSNITYLDNETIVVSVGVNNATGRVTITLKDKDGNVVVLDDSVVVSKNITEEGSQSVTFTVPGLAVGDYTVEVKYDSDANYEDAETSAPFLVNPANSTVTVEPVNITYLDDETITVTVPIANASGTVVVKLNGTVVDERTVSGDNPSYAISIEGLAVGEYNVTVEYSNDPNYNDSEASALFHVDKANIPDVPDTEGLVVIPTNITYLDDETITVTLDVPNATGKVTIKINGTDVELSKNITEEGSQTVTFTVPGLVVGDYNVTVEYTDDANYNDYDASAIFTVSPAASSVDEVPVDITYGDDETITVTVPVENATGKVTISINGTDIELSKNITEEGSNTVTFTVPGLVVGDYNVTAKYSDDANYNDSENSALFTVSKANVTDMTVVPTNITYLDDETIVVTVDANNATGKVTITINGTDVELTESVDGDGKATFTVPGLVVGEYNVTANYHDDPNYNDSEASALFHVDKANITDINVTPTNITYGDNETITVSIGDNNATGSITIKVNGTEYGPQELKDGSTTFNVPGLLAGDYEVEVSYSGDDNYNATSANAEFTVDKAKPTVYAIGTNITYGDDEQITAIVDGKNVTGTVTVFIDGEEADVLY